MRYIRVIDVQDTQVAIVKCVENGVTMLRFLTVIKGHQLEAVKQFPNEIEQGKFFYSIGMGCDAHADFVDQARKVLAMKVAAGDMTLGSDGKTYDTGKLSEKSFSEQLRKGFSDNNKKNIKLN